eukprot:1402264-Prymnesium_polylepis.5
MWSRRRGRQVAKQPIALMKELHQTHADGVSGEETLRQREFLGSTCSCEDAMPNGRRARGATATNKAVKLRGKVLHIRTDERCRGAKPRHRILSPTATGAVRCP